MKEKNYKFGVFYYDKENPNVFVDESFNLTRGIAFNGQIINVAHWEKFVGILGLGLPIGIAAFMIF